jgi:hypothetical protein
MGARTVSGRPRSLRRRGGVERPAFSGRGTSPSRADSATSQATSYHAPWRDESMLPAAEEAEGQVVRVRREISVGLSLRTGIP